MMTLEEYLEKQINEYLKQAVLSGNRKEGVGTVKIPSGKDTGADLLSGFCHGGYKGAP